MLLNPFLWVVLPFLAVAGVAVWAAIELYEP